MNNKTIIGIDPGLKGGLAVIDGDGKLLLTLAFKDGLPPKKEKFSFVYFLMECDYNNLIFIRETHVWHLAEAPAKRYRRSDGDWTSKVTANAIYGSGYYTGFIDLWLLLKAGVTREKLLKVDALTWKKLLGKNAAQRKMFGKDTAAQTRAYLLDRYGQEVMKEFFSGPRGGYLDGCGAACCIALWKLNALGFELGGVK
jgi:hypothetical protein